MHKIIPIILEAMLASVFLIPVFTGLGKKRFHDSKTTFLYTLLAIYLGGVYAAAGLPNVIYVRFVPRFNFIPFQYMFSDYSNSLLNVILFIPLGFFLVLLWKPFRNPGWNILMGLCLSCAIEVLQIFTYRATDINDLITNTFGCIIGYLLGMLCIRRIPPQSRPLRELDLVFSATTGIMFFLQPFLSRLIWCAIS